MFKRLNGKEANEAFDNAQSVVNVHSEISLEIKLVQSKSRQMKNKS